MTRLLMLMLVAFITIGCATRPVSHISIDQDAASFADQVSNLREQRERAEGILRSATNQQSAQQFYETVVKPKGNALTTHLALLTASGTPTSCNTPEDPGCAKRRLEELVGAIDELARRSGAPQAGGAVATILLWKPIIEWLAGSAIKAHEMRKKASAEERARIDGMLKERAEEVRKAGTFRSAKEVLSS